MDTIRNYHGQDCNLSDEVYVITNDYTPSDMAAGSPYYLAGDYVRLIQSPEDFYVGQHHNPKWAQVCRLNAPIPAEFRGIEKKYLRRVDTVDGLQNKIDPNGNYVMTDPETKRQFPTVFTGQQVLNFIAMILKHQPLIRPRYLLMLSKTNEPATNPLTQLGF